MTWTPTQLRAFQVALAVAEKWEDAIARLEQLAKHAPAFAERVAELRARRDNLEQLAKTAIAVNTK